MSSEALQEALYRRMKLVINRDNPDIDLNNQRHGFVVTAVVNTEEDYQIMHYKLDPKAEEWESVSDADDVGMMLHLGHKTQPDLWNHIAEKVMPFAAIKSMIDRVFK